jgi:hypothetical protein
VQHLQQDLAAVLVHGLRHRAQLPGLRQGVQHRRVFVDARFGIGGEAAGDDQRRTAARASGVERGLALDGVAQQFEAGVHRAHHHAVAQPVSAGLQWRQQRRAERLAGH